MGLDLHPNIGQTHDPITCSLCFDGPGAAPEGFSNLDEPDPSDDLTKSPIERAEQLVSSLAPPEPDALASYHPEGHPDDQDASDRNLTENHRDLKSLPSYGDFDPKLQAQVFGETRLREGPEASPQTVGKLLDIIDEIAQRPTTRNVIPIGDSTRLVVFSLDLPFDMAAKRDFWGGQSVDLFKTEGETTQYRSGPFNYLAGVSDLDWVKGFVPSSPNQPRYHYGAGKPAEPSESLYVTDQGVPVIERWINPRPGNVTHERAMKVASEAEVQKVIDLLRSLRARQGQTEAR